MFSVSVIAVMPVYFSQKVILYHLKNQTVIIVVRYDIEINIVSKKKKNIYLFYF